jgi:hypothetical protein
VLSASSSGLAYAAHRIPGIHLGDSLSDAVRVVETALAG